MRTADPARGVATETGVSALMDPIGPRLDRTRGRALEGLEIIEGFRWELQRPIQVFDRHVEMPKYADSYIDYKTAVVDGGIYIPSIRLNQPLQAECAHFVECVENNTRPQSRSRRSRISVGDGVSLMPGGPRRAAVP